MFKKQLIWTAVVVFTFVMGTGLFKMFMFWFGSFYSVKSFQIFYGKPNKEKLTELPMSDTAIIEPSAMMKQDVSFLKKARGWFGSLYSMKSFQIFYGKPDKEKLIELTMSDAAIIEPSAMTKQDVSFLKEAGVRLFGYISLMQLENWNEELKKRISGSDFAVLDGERIHVKEWDTYVMDLRELHYREILLWKIERYIVDRGLDGIFFDTVDDIDYYFHEHKKVQNDMRTGYKALLEELKRQYPELLIIQNRGFETYRAVLHSNVDGLLWEGFRAKDAEESEWTKNWLKYFKKEQWRGRVRILTVVGDEESRKLSEKNCFPAFVQTGDTYQK